MVRNAMHVPRIRSRPIGCFESLVVYILSQRRSAGAIGSRGVKNPSPVILPAYAFGGSRIRAASRKLPSRDYIQNPSFFFESHYAPPRELPTSSRIAPLSKNLERGRYLPETYFCFPGRSSRVFRRIDTYFNAQPSYMLVQIEAFSLSLFNKIRTRKAFLQ